MLEWRTTKNRDLEIAPTGVFFAGSAKTENRDLEIAPTDDVGNRDQEVAPTEVFFAGMMKTENRDLEIAPTEVFFAGLVERVSSISLVSINYIRATVVKPGGV